MGRKKEDTLSLALAKELGPRNIRVNIVAPGHTETEGLHRIGLIGSELGNLLIASTPLGSRFGQPKDIAPTVVFLASTMPRGLLANTSTHPAGFTKRSGFSKCVVNELISIGYQDLEKRSKTYCSVNHCLSLNTFGVRV